MLRRLRDAIQDFGEMLLFAGESFAWAVRPPFRWELALAQMAAIGVGSIFIVTVTGVFSGMVLALQMNYGMRKFGAEGYVGGSVAFSLVRELGPVFTALMVTGRSGSAISTELGTMRVTEQIDALETMAVNPLQYLVVPRVLASLLMFPTLAMLFSTVGYVGAYAVGVGVLDIPAGPFIEHTRALVNVSDILHGLLKATVFGWVVSIITTYRGYAARGGAQGVGEGTTRAVVMSSVSVLVVNYFITLLAIGGGR